MNSSLVSLAQRAERKIRRVLGIKGLPELDQRLSQMERVFSAPRLTPELVAAIKLISPQFDLAPNERHRAFWETDQNGSCWAEYEALKPFLSRITPDSKILEIGPGLGRSLVFFAKKLGWSGSRLHAYEGDSFKTWITQYKYHFCGNIAILRSILDFNGVAGVTIFDASNVSVANLPGSYGLIYSFYSIGFHLPLEDFLNDIFVLLEDGGTAVFTTRAEFEPFERLKKLSYRLVDWKPVWPKDANLKFVVLFKT